MFFSIGGVGFFDYMFIISVLATIITIAFKGSGRIRYNDIIDEKGKSQSGQNKVKPKDILSIRFGAGY